MSQNTEVKSKRTKRPVADRIREIGQFTLQRIERETVPSDALIAEIEKAVAELKITQDLAASLPDSHKAIGETAVRNSEFRVNALREKMANPNNASSQDVMIAAKAAYFILRTGKYSFVSLVQFVAANMAIFPLKGEKY